MTPSTTHQPPLTKKGWINTYYRYYKGKRLGPYYVRRWKLNGKLHKEYIKPDQVEEARAECQRHREAKKEIVRWLNNTTTNLKYLERMIKWSDQGRLRPEDHAYIDRIQKEGYDIGGRPPLRKKIVRQFATYNGQTVIVKTVFELDGTTRSFMVPFFTNPFSRGFEIVTESLQDIARKISEEIFGARETKTPPPNPWLHPAF